MLDFASVVRSRSWHSLVLSIPLGLPDLDLVLEVAFGLLIHPVHRAAFAAAVLADRDTG